MFKNLFEEHKAERRQRILAAARRLIARGGWERLGMRELAAEARVSVPTVYNLIGGKPQLLSALMEAQLSDVARALATAPLGETVVERAQALCAAGHRVLLEAPGYTRELVHLFLTSEEARAVRRVMDERNVALMSALLAGGQAEGDLEPWADPRAVARTMYTLFVANLIGWAMGELDDAGLEAATGVGNALILLGFARGRARTRLERLVRDQQKELSHVASSHERGRRRSPRPPRR